MVARVQENRTTTPNAPPANGSLQVGELFVEMATPLRLWSGVPTTIDPTGRRLIIDATAQGAANSAAVQKAGDTMTGPLVLSGQPTVASQAANKAYVDTVGPTMAPVQTVATRVGNVTLTHTDILDWTSTLNTALAPYAPLASPVLSGAPTSPTPTAGDSSTKIATTAFVAATIAAGPPAGAVVAATPPVEPPGTLWWDSTGGQLYLRYDDGNSQQWVTTSNVEGLANAATKTDVAGALANVGRNVLHNPLFNVAQRGVGTFTVTGAYLADRWQQWFAGGSISTAINPANDTFRSQAGDEAMANILYSIFTGTAGASDVSLVQQNIEGVRRLGGTTVTVSFWAAGAGLKLGVSIDQNFGTGGSPSASVTGVGQAASLTGAFVRYSMTFALPSTAGKTLGTNNNDTNVLNLYLSSGTTFAVRAGNIGVQSGAIGIWGVQLEVGSVATPLEKPDPRYDLSNCQRFYVGLTTLASFNGWAGGANQYLSWPVTLPVTMRATPTIILTPGSGANYTSVPVTPGATVFTVQLQSAATGVTFWGGQYTASADL